MEGWPLTESVSADLPKQSPRNVLLKIKQEWGDKDQEACSVHPMVECGRKGLRTLILKKEMRIPEKETRGCLK